MGKKREMLVICQRRRQPSKLVIRLIALLLVINQAIRAGTTNNNVNLCEGATVTASLGSSFLSRANDGNIANNFYCGTSCPTIQLDAGIAWITLDLGYVTSISTIIFLTDAEENIDGFGSMIRTAGTVNDISDTVNNKLLTQVGGTNYPMMVADINENGAYSVRYIHWTSSQAFKFTDILCYANKRLYDTDMTTVKNYFLAPNSAIDVTSCTTESSEFTNYQYS